MDRREFLKKGAVIGGAAALAVASPALAAHVGESTEPIIGIGFNLWNYPNAKTVVNHRLLIPESGTQPPAGVPTFPAKVEILDRIGPAGVPVATIDAITWTTYGESVTFDAATGLPIIAGNGIRTEPKVAIARDARVNQRASEHWSVRLVINRITNLARDNRQKLWDTFVHHANVPPHDPEGGDVNFKQGYWEAEQDNDYPVSERAIPGEILAASWQLDGWATKRRFNIEVKFVWGGQG